MSLIDTFFQLAVALPEVTTVLQKQEEFNESQFFEKLQDIASKYELKYSELMKSLRICLMGSKVSTY